jgi:hypothetical protein
MADKRLVTGILVVVFMVPALVQALREGNLRRRGPHGRIDRHR